MSHERFAPYLYCCTNDHCKHRWAQYSPYCPACGYSFYLTLTEDQEPLAG